MSNPDLIPEQWEPGVPLYNEMLHPYSHYLYDFKDDTDRDEQCNCTDSARWPLPWPGHVIHPTPNFEPGPEVPVPHLDLLTGEWVQVGYVAVARPPYGDGLVVWDTPE